MRAVALPGRAYRATQPVLALPIEVLERHGYDVHAVRWDLDGLPPGPTGFVAGRLRGAARGGCDLVVAKSLGTRATAYAAERSWPAIWLTPLLDDEACVAGIAANPAPQLLVGGDADPCWDPAVAASLPCEVLELVGADHALSRTGDHVVDAETGDRLVAAVAEFVERLAGGQA